MPSAMASDAPSNRHDDLDNYDVGDLSDDPFRSPSPPSKKRKDPDQSGLGLDEEVSVQKRARIPNVKLDEQRLLGPAGIPKLRSRAANLKIKGKGHEFSDAARLLSFYQLWLDDLFPKAKFLDALAMVEKAGHKKMLQIKRNEWINESKPKEKDDADYIDDSFYAPNTNAPVAAVAEMPGTGKTSAQDRPKTPEPGQDDVPDDDDLYDATPRTTRRTVPITTINNDEPDADDLDALMAEAETHDTSNLNKKPHTRPEHDEDELDALIAEAEGHDERPQSSATAAKENAGQRDDRDFADEEAAMQEMDGLW